MLDLSSHPTGEYTARSNALTSLPAEFGNLTNLVELNLNGNELTSLPPEFANLTRLETLNLGSTYVFGAEEHLRNRLTSLPAGFGNLTNLTTLDLSTNNPATLPTSLDNLTNLHNLNLRRNRLRGDITSLGAGLADDVLYILIGDGTGFSDCLTTNDPPAGYCARRGQ